MEKTERSIIFWEGRVAPGTYDTYMSAFRLFIGWLAENGGALAGLGPDALIAYQKETDNGTEFDLLDLVQTWAQGLKTPDGVDCRASYKKSCYASLRSFFAHNRAPLPRDPYTLRSETPGYEGTLTVENIRDVALASKPLYRAIFLSMFQGGMDIKSFLRWNRNGWEDLRQELSDEYVDSVKIKLPFRKLNLKPFSPRIGGDAIKAIRDYLPTRPTREEARVKHERDGKKEPFVYHIFYTQFKTPIKKTTLQHYWMDRLTKLGLVKRRKGRGQRYGKNLHELRDVFRSQWEKTPSKGSVAEYMMGHKVDPLEYNKAHKDEKWVRKEYRKALPLLEIMSSGRPFGLVEEDSVDDLQRKLAEQAQRVAALEGELADERRNKVGYDLRFSDMEKRMKYTESLVQMMPQKEREVDRTRETAKEPEGARAGGM